VPLLPRQAALLLAALLLAPVLAACSGTGGTDQASAAPGVIKVKAADRVAAPDLAGPKVGGGNLALADYRGRIVVLNVWGSWCAPCRKETPALVASSKELAKQRVAFLGLDNKDNDEAAAAFQRAFGVRYPSFSDPDGRLLLTLRGSVPPKAIPSTLVLDPQGRIAASVVGAVTQRQLSELVGEVLLETARGAGAPSSTASPSS
jgi:thiol-disulfide isomerase/thioredoxin